MGLKSSLGIIEDLYYEAPAYAMRMLGSLFDTLQGVAPGALGTAVRGDMGKGVRGVDKKKLTIKTRLG